MTNNNNTINLAEFDFNAFQEDAIAQLKSGQTLTGKDGVLTPLIKKILEAALEGEMEAHLSDCREQGLPNRRNGKQTKTVKSGVGSFELETPRDRDSSYKYLNNIVEQDHRFIKKVTKPMKGFKAFHSAKATLAGIELVLSQKNKSRFTIDTIQTNGGTKMIRFKWRHFKQDIILMLIRWYLAYSLSYRDIEELALERGLKVDHSTINRWVIDYSPQLEEAFRQRYKRPVGISWRMDETYVKLKGQWVYLYRAVDKKGKTVDFMLSEKRDEPAARAFFEKAIGSHGLPDKVAMDKSGANKAGIDAINLHLALLFMLGGLFAQLTVRQIKYLNNIVEQDHRFIKKITKPMKGFKAFNSADATLAGIELHHMLRKGQHEQSSKKTIFEQFYGLAA